ncbi:MAG TPA: hypothetical protein VF477_19305 [Mycobacterium sp.]
MTNTFDTAEKLPAAVDFVTDPDMRIPDTDNGYEYPARHRVEVFDKPEPDTETIEPEVFDLDLSDEDEDFDEDNEDADFDEDEDEV